MEITLSQRKGNDQMSGAAAKPHISVIVPVYNGAGFLREAVESICCQNYHPLEIIIVDDGSTDSTPEIAKSLQKRVLYFRQPNSGPSSARNKGIQIARGDIIGFLDADDLWLENHSELLQEFAAEPRADIVMGRVQLLIPSRTIDGRTEFEKFADPAITFNLGSALYRKSVFNKVGLFDPKLHYSEDLDWFMRARECGVSIRILDQVTLFYRRHGNNMTYKKLRNDHNLARVLKKSLDRRREGDSGCARELPKVSEFCINKVETLSNGFSQKENEADKLIKK